jgi:hypothetical protein
MISPKIPTQAQPLEPATGRPVASGEQWLGRNASNREASGRRLWERLNPRHRKQLRLLARALALRQSQARLPEDVRARLAATLEDLERLAARIERLLATLATRTLPGG